MAPTLEDVVKACTAPLDPAVPEPLESVPDIRFLMAGQRVRDKLAHHSLSDLHVNVKHDLDTFLMASPWYEQMSLWHHFRLSNSTSKATEISVSSKITR